MNKVAGHFHQAYPRCGLRIIGRAVLHIVVEDKRDARFSEANGSTRGWLDQYARSVEKIGRPLLHLRNQAALAHNCRYTCHPDRQKYDDQRCHVEDNRGLRRQDQKY